MAKIRKNAVVHGASGKFGDLIVFRQLPDGRTIMTEAPGRDPNRKPSEKQKTVYKNFQMATVYAKGAIRTPGTKELYKEGSDDNKMLSPYNVAVADFFHAPAIEEIDLSTYKGKPGDTIQITATDDFMVKEVQVVIYNPDGEEADKGMAEQDEINDMRWVWTASKKNDATKGDKIVVMASDLPGHIAKKEQELA